MIWTMMRMKLNKKNKFLYLSFLFILGCSNVQKDYDTIKPEYLILKGMNLKSSGEYSKALAFYEVALKKGEESSLLYEELGETYTKLGDYSKGIKYYEKALKKTSYTTDINRNLSYVYYLKGDYKRALEYLEKIYDNMLNLESKKLKGFLLIKNKKYKEALEYLKNLENEITVFDKTYYTNYVNLILKKGNSEDLSKVLYEIFNKYYDNIDGMTLYFYTKEKTTKDLEELEKELKEYIVTHEKNDNLYILLAEIEAKLKKFKEKELVLKFVSPKGKTEKNYIKLIGENYE